jgi:hypothetical protein
LTSNRGSRSLTSRSNRDFKGRGSIEGGESVDIKASIKGSVANDSDAIRHIEVARDFDILTSSTSQNEVGASNASDGSGDHWDTATKQFGDSSLADSRCRGIVDDKAVSRSHPA